jgi:lysophospholipase L1-like esterase
MTDGPARATGRDVRIAFFGDSFTAGVGDPTALGWVGRVVARAREAGWDLTGYGLGVRRETTPDVSCRLLPEARPRLVDGQAHGVVLATGVNDTTVEGGRRRVSPDGTAAALDRVLDAAATVGWPATAPSGGSPTSRSRRHSPATPTGSPRWPRSTARTQGPTATPGSPT